MHLYASIVLRTISFAVWLASKVCVQNGANAWMKDCIGTSALPSGITRGLPCATSTSVTQPWSEASLLCMRAARWLGKLIAPRGTGIAWRSPLVGRFMTRFSTGMALRSHGPSTTRTPLGQNGWVSEMCLTYPSGSALIVFGGSI